MAPLFACQRKDSDGRFGRYLLFSLTSNKTMDSLNNRILANSRTFTSVEFDDKIVCRLIHKWCTMLTPEWGDASFNVRKEWVKFLPLSKETSTYCNCTHFFTESEIGVIYYTTDINKDMNIYSLVVLLNTWLILYEDAVFSSQFTFHGIPSMNSSERGGWKC